MLFDTEFIICLGRSPKSKVRQRANAFLSANECPLYASFVTLAEVWEGVGDAERERGETLTSRFTVLPLNEEVVWEASRVGRQLKGRGLHIGDNDVWIAATALVYDLAVVSNNKEHLGSVRGLRLRGY